jgi:tRNA (mo5U34)-methyltransferase
MSHPNCCEIPLDKALLERVRSRKWFYEFDLPDGSRTQSYLPPGVEKIHATRLAMLERGLAARFGADLAGVTAVDLACHEGWFALHMARRGATVLGLDVRQAHVDDALLIARATGAQRFSARTFDVEEGRAAEVGVHDVTLMLGLLYHLENPMRALRLARAVTRKALFIETQVVPHMSGLVDWGSYTFQRRMVGVFGIVDELGEEHAPEAGTAGICLAPSVEALEWLLRKVGFEHVERIAPPDDGYEQHVGNKRVMFAAYPG